MGWAQWRMFLARIRSIRERSPLLLIILALFIGGYIGIGFFLFERGLDYLHHFPLVGALLAQRIVFLVFSCFFVMLIFSNLIIGYATLFKNKETAWLLTMPIRQRDIYRWKFLEGLAISSWALIFLSAPMMLAYGKVNDVSPSFYGKVALAYVPFVALPGFIGSWIVLGLVFSSHYKWVKRAMVVLGLGLVLSLTTAFPKSEGAAAAITEETLSFDRMLRHTRLTQHVLLPSSWMAQTVLASANALMQQGAFYFGVLLSNAMMAGVISFAICDRLFYKGWSLSLSSRTTRAHLDHEVKRRKRMRYGLLDRVIDRLPFSPPVRALVAKDMRLFSRDPAQWSQFLIFFALLCIYGLNLRNISFNLSSLYWETLVSYLNLAASALTLSTLTTRFVFPQFSLEGRRLWMVGMAPVGLQRVLLQKFWMSFALSTVMTIVLILISSIMLKLSWERTIFFAMTIFVLSASLSGLAVGLSALFPHLKEDNPSKIVSGFGGTLCLAVSFVYIILFIGLIAIPALEEATSIPGIIPGHVAFVTAFAVSLVVLFLPMILALRRVKNLEF